MFQNINETEKTKEDLAKQKNIFANVISKKYICLYIVTLMVSMVNMGYDVSPFSLAIVAASIANEIPIIAIIVLALTGNIICAGAGEPLSLSLHYSYFLQAFL